MVKYDDKSGWTSSQYLDRQELPAKVEGNEWKVKGGNASVVDSFLTLCWQLLTSSIADLFGQ